MHKTLIERVKLWGFPLISTQLNDVLTDLTQRATLSIEDPTDTLLIGTPNPEQLVLTRKNEVFAQHLHQLDWLLPDGIGLVVASKIFSWRWGSNSIKARISGRVVAAGLMEFSAANDQVRVLVLGGRNLGGGEPSADLIRLRRSAQTDQLFQLQPISLGNGVKIAKSYWYWLEGYADIANPTREEEQAVLRVIAELKPVIVCVALGAPNQEAWLVAHRQILQEAGVAIGLAVGGAFNVLTGTLAIPPLWLERLGLEWLFRLFQQPWRWRRQLALVSYMLMVVRALFSRPELVD